MRIGIRAKFAALTVLTALVPLSGYFYANYEKKTVWIEQQIQEDFGETSKKSAQKLDDWELTNESALAMLAAYPGLSDMTPEDAKATLANAVKNYAWVRASFLTNEDGQQVARSDAEAPVNVGDRPYFKDAKSNGFGQQLIVSRVTGKPSLILAKPVFDSARSFKGVAAFAVDLAAISKEVVAQPWGKTGFKFILTKDGKLLAHWKEEEAAKGKEGQLVDYSQHPMWKNRSAEGGAKIVTFNDDKGEWMGVIEPTSIGWSVVTVQKTEESKAPLIEQQSRALLAMGGALGFALLAALITATAVVKPIRKLKEVADAMAAGKFDMRELDAIKSKDEVGRMARSLGRLGGAVRGAMEAMMGGAKRK